MLSYISSSIIPAKKVAHKRTSILNSNHSSPTSSHKSTDTSCRIMSEFDDRDIFNDTPLSRLVKRIRQLEELTVEDKNIITSLDQTTLVDLLFEFNSALRFNFALKNKQYG